MVQPACQFHEPLSIYCASLTESEWGMLIHTGYEIIWLPNTFGGSLRTDIINKTNSNRKE